MVYKLSNVVDRRQIEKDLGLQIRYPNLYAPQLVVNGFEETNLAIITAENSQILDFAIWGLMPQNYKEDWSTYQNVCNTLNVNLEQLRKVSWMRNTLKERRCLILASGFFCYFLRRNKIYTYYVSQPEEKPFFLGGIWNRLDDGFLSCSLITTKANKFISSFHNVDNQMPMIITDGLHETWLSESTDKRDIENIIQNPPNPRLRANPIANDFFKNNIIYDSILQPVHYDGIPEGGQSNS